MRLAAAVRTVVASDTEDGMKVRQVQISVEFASTTVAATMSSAL